MASRTAPFAAFEWAIAWRYLRARRSEGGISVMSVISLIGIALAVFALIATLAVRTGFRIEFVGTILGANAHATVYSHYYDEEETGARTRLIRDYAAWTEAIKQVPGVTRAAPIIKAQIMATANGRNAGVEVYGESLADLKTLPLVAEPLSSLGNIDDYETGVAIGVRLAAELGISVGDYITLISPDGLKTPFGTSPRIVDYPVVYMFEVGRYDIDGTRVYMPFAEAQSYFNAEGAAHEIEVMVADPEAVEDVVPGLFEAVGDPRADVWTWQQSSRSFLNALQMEDNIMFVILSILVLIATMNIVSGLIMLVKNKGRDIGILRTIGLTEGSVLRVFFICGASIGVIGTLIGVVLGCLFAIYIDPIFGFINSMLGGGAWSPQKFGLPDLPAQLTLADVLKAMSLSLGLSFIITIFPARRAARMNPVEALRYE